MHNHKIFAVFFKAGSKCFFTAKCAGKFKFTGKAILRQLSLAFFTLIISCNCSTAQQSIPAGISYKIFNETDGLRDRNITGLIFDKDGIGWVGCSDGLFLYDGLKFHRASLFFPALKDTFNAPVFALFYNQSQDEIVIVKVENNKLAFYSFNKAVYDKVRAKSISSIYKEDTEGVPTCLVRFNNGFAYNLTGHLNIITVTRNDTVIKRFLNNVNALTSDVNGNICFASKEQIFYTINRADPGNRILELGKISANEYNAFFYYRQYIKKWDTVFINRDWPNIQKLSSLQSLSKNEPMLNTIGSSVTDSWGNIFLYSAYGLVKFSNIDNQAFTAMPHNYEPRGIYYNSVLNTGIVGTSHGLFNFSVGKKKLIPVTTINPDNYLVSYLRTPGNNLYFFNYFQEKQSFLTDTTLGKVNSFTLNSDYAANASCNGPGDIFYLGNKGLYVGKIIGKMPVINPYVLFTDSSLINAVLYEKKYKKIYVSTEKGLYQLDAGDGYYKSKQLIKGNFVCLDTLNNQLFAGSRTNGLFSIDIKKESVVNVLSEKNGLPGNTIFSIVTDNRHNLLWLGTKNGLVVYHPGFKQFYTYTDKDGLAHNEFNRNSTFKSNNLDLLIMGGLKGLTIIKPGLIVKSDSAYLRQTILGLAVNYKNGEDSFIPVFVNKLSRIIIEPTVRNLNIITKKSGNNNLIFIGYQINNNEWQYVTGQSDIVLEDPDAGNYTVKVKFIGADKKEGNVCVLNFYIKEVWYKGWLFRSAVLLFVFLCIFLFLKWRNHLQQLKTQQEINNYKERMVGIIAHDLRSPVKTYQGMAGILNYLIQKKDYSKILDAAEDLDQISYRLDTLIDNLLNWSLLQQNSINPNCVEINLQELITELLPVYNIMARYKNCTIEFTNQGCNTIYADKQMVNLILRNLIDNAIKHAPSNTTVNILIADSPLSTQLVINNEINSTIIKQTESYFAEFENIQANGAKRLGLKFVQQAANLLNIKIQLRVLAGKVVCDMHFLKSR